MSEVLLIICVALLAIVVVLQVLILRRRVGIDLGPIEQALASVEKLYERLERSVKDEISTNRREAAVAARDSRVELTGALKGVGDTLNQQIVNLTQTNEQRLDKVRETMAGQLQTMQDANTRLAADSRKEATDSAGALRGEVGESLKAFSTALISSVGTVADAQKGQLEVFGGRIDALAKGMEEKLGAVNATVGNGLARLQEGNEKRLDQMRLESNESAGKAREEVTAALKNFNESVANRVNDLSAVQKAQLEEMGKQLVALTAEIQQRFDRLRTAIEERLKAIQEDNAKQLDQMRATVDEKLQGTLEKRLGESFNLVSERLEKVHQGLGEMQKLATGVGDLKKVLTNVKTRGTWGEVQLGALLEQVLSSEQYEANFAPKEGGERVEFAIKLPGRSDDAEEVVWLPIDAKFPIEDYTRLVEAQEKADPAAAEEAGKQLETRIRQCASDIRRKYLNPPKTTDFAILFLPMEGLFAEVLRRTGLPESIQNDHRVVIAGPTTLWALLNSLQMGFKTLAIQKRSSEVWNLLGAVKTEWSKYGEVIEKVKKKLDEASNTIDLAAQRSRAVGRKLRDVQELPMAATQDMLKLDGTVMDAEPDDNAG